MAEKKHVIIDADVHKELKKKAAEDGVTIGQLLEKAALALLGIKKDKSKEK